MVIIKYMTVTIACKQGTCVLYKQLQPARSLPREKLPGWFLNIINTRVQHITSWGVCVAQPFQATLSTSVLRTECDSCIDDPNHPAGDV